jgi:uncharacterized protein (UPF0264 family)
MGAAMNLLVSVRSAAEAEAALAGGAGLIDVKEPSRGSLGRADAAVLAAVLDMVAGRRPVSAALGELKEGTRPISPEGDTGRVPTFVKWGLAGYGIAADRRRDLLHAASLLPSPCRPVAVAYADWRRAAAPSPADVCAFACEHRWGAFLIDTWQKDGSTLLDWCSLHDLSAMRARCRAAGVPVALAGSLGADQIRDLRALRPDWFAVRGAVCHQGVRTQLIDADRVRRLVDLLGERVTAATGAS